MPTHINTRYAELETVWDGVLAFQNLAEHYGVHDIFQDAGGKMVQLAVATGVELVEDRNGPDAVDRIGNQYEIKSTDIAKTTGGFSTNHHLNHATIKKFSSRRFIFAIYEGITLMEAYFVEAKQLEPYFANWRRKLKTKTHLNKPIITVKCIREKGTVAYLKDVAPDWALN